jgi:hypothetical protein
VLLTILLCGLIIDIRTLVLLTVLLCGLTTDIKTLVLLTILLCGLTTVVKKDSCVAYNTALWFDN